MTVGLKATLVTSRVPLEDRVLPGAASQTFTVWSPLAKASRGPSGLNATLAGSYILAAPPLRRKFSLPAGGIPDFTVPSPPDVASFSSTVCAEECNPGLSEPAPRERSGVPRQQDDG